MNGAHPLTGHSVYPRCDAHEQLRRVKLLAVFSGIHDFAKDSIEFIQLSMQAPGDRRLITATVVAVKKVSGKK